jgi:hypothetical protein
VSVSQPAPKRSYIENIVEGNEEPEDTKRPKLMEVPAVPLLS